MPRWIIATRTFAFTALLVWFGPAKAQEAPALLVECPKTATTNAEITARAESSLTAWSFLPDHDAWAAQDAVTTALYCTNEVLSSNTLALVYLSEATAAHRAGDMVSALVALQAARLIDADRVLPAALLRAEPGLDLLYASAVRPGAPDTEKIVTAEGNTVYVDGVASVVRPKERPTVIQVADARGQVFWTRMVAARQPVPSDFPAVEARPFQLYTEAARRLRMSVEGGIGLRYTPSHHVEHNHYELDKQILFNRDAYLLGTVVYEACPMLCTRHSFVGTYYRPSPSLHASILFALFPNLEIGLSTKLSLFTMGTQGEAYVYKNIDDTPGRTNSPKLMPLAEERELLEIIEMDTGSVDALHQKKYGGVFVIGLTFRLYLRRQGWRPYIAFTSLKRMPFFTPTVPYPLFYGDVNGDGVEDGFVFTHQPTIRGRGGVRLSMGMVAPIGRNLALGGQMSIVSPDAFLHSFWGPRLSETIENDENPEFNSEPLEVAFPLGLTFQLTLRWQPYTPPPRKPKDQRRRKRKKKHRQEQTSLTGPEDGLHQRVAIFCGPRMDIASPQPS
jgi:hypothetical protein